MSLNVARQREHPRHNEYTRQTRYVSTCGRSHMISGSFLWGTARASHARLDAHLHHRQAERETGSGRSWKVLRLRRSNRRCHGRYQPRDEPLVLRRPIYALHRMRLAAARLTIRHHRRAVAAQHALHKRGCHRLEHLRLQHVYIYAPPPPLQFGLSCITSPTPLLMHRYDVRRGVAHALPVWTPRP